MIRPIQILAARALLTISQAELAKLAGVGLATLQRIEAARTEVSGSAKTLWKVQKALEVAGAVFIDQDEEKGPGVRLSRPLE